MRKKVFISSTVHNFRYLRQVLVDRIGELDTDAYASELPEFPVQGDLHPIEECLDNIRHRATHFVLLLGARWGLPYRDGAEHSITEMEFFEARQRGLPLLCFIENETWHEARQYHGAAGNETMLDALTFRTDRRVLRFIENELMHGDVSWISAFHHYRDILARIAVSWLIWERREQELYLFRLLDQQQYDAAINAYAKAFDRFLAADGPLPQPVFRDFPDLKSQSRIDVGYGDAFAKAISRLDDVLRLGNALLWPEGTRQALHPPEERQYVFEKVLKTCIRVLRARFYLDERGSFPDGGRFLPAPLSIGEPEIRRTMGWAEEELVRIKVRKGPENVPVGHLPFSVARSWRDVCFSKVEWASLIVPQAVLGRDLSPRKDSFVLLAGATSITGDGSNGEMYICSCPVE